MTVASEYVKRLGQVMRKWLIYLTIAGILLYGLTFLAVSVFTYNWTNPEVPEKADVIVCLGAGMDPDGTLHLPAIRRVRTCVQLFNANVAPRIHFTGGRATPTGPSAGEQMALLAMTMQVPETAVTRENNSLSTLQNAYFSQPMLADATRILIVTEAFHLPRSGASFRLFGSHNVRLFMSMPIRLRGDGTWEWRMIRREAAAIWFNGLRVGVWWIGGVLGADGRDSWLN